MHARSKDLVPAIMAAAIAIVGLATMFFTDFVPKDEPERTGITMITAAVVERAGATVLPTEPAVTRVRQRYAGNGQDVGGQEPEDDRRLAR